MYEKYTYNNKKLLSYIYENLPMNEFLTGNFSHAGEIVQQFRKYIVKNISESRKTILEGYETYDSYIEDIDYIAHKLLCKKSGLFDMQKDERINKVFEVISDALETDFLKDEYSELWNSDYRQFDHNKNNLRKIILHLYGCVRFDSDLEPSYIIEKIEELYQQSINNQILLFDT